jgi:hypothetical protein
MQNEVRSQPVEALVGHRYHRCGVMLNLSVLRQTTRQEDL